LSIDLSVVIVNYHSVDLIVDNLTSLYNYIPADAVEIIIVNNDNEQGRRILLQEKFPSVRWIDMGYNSGFSRANNAGISIATGEVILLLNPDTLCIDDSILQCYKRLRESNYVAAGVQLLDRNKQPQISGSYFVRGGLNHVLPIPYWGHFIRWMGYTLKTKVPGVTYAATSHEVDWISGAFLMARKDAIVKAGMLDEDFFLYAEEVEWCSRLKKVGKLVIFGDLHIIHLEGETINSQLNLQEKGYYNLYDRKGLQLMVSNHLRVRKQYGVFWFLVLLLNYTLGLFVFMIGSIFFNLFKNRKPLKEWNRISAFGKNLVVLWQLSPTIISNKRHFYKML
jgi:GT2 family glycosyltransferase